MTGVCDEFGINVVIECEDVNTKIIKFNNKDQTIITLIHDAKTVIQTCQILRKIDSVKPLDRIGLFSILLKKFICAIFYFLKVMTSQ